MFDIGWSEMAIIMVLALIVIGPRDLPRVARTVGQWVRKGRMLAREFQNSLDDMVRETELEDVKKEIEKVGRTDVKKAVENTIDPKGELTKAFDTTADSKEIKPALTDRSGNTDNKMPIKAAANGHADDGTKAESKPSPEPAKKSAATKETTAKSTKTANRSKTTAAKTTASKPASARKPATKRAAKPATSTAKPKTKRGPAKRSPSKKAAIDDGGGADQAAVAAKSS